MATSRPEWFNADSGEAHYRQALALAEPRGIRPLAAHCHFELGKLDRRIGDPAKPHEPLTTATTMYREMDMRFRRSVPAWRVVGQTPAKP